MSKIKWSPYNILVELEEPQQGLVYNGASGELMFLKNRLYDAYKENRVGKLLPGERAVLKQKGILCVNSNEQKQKLQHQFLDLKSSGETATFIFAGTMNCNLSCHYCYESHACIEKHTMSADVAERTIEFICSTMEDPGKQSAVLKFYGGEPLLKFDLCREVAAAIQNRLDAMGKQLITWIQSNGVLIEESMFTEPFPGLACVEITIDGPKSKHDRVRVNQFQTPTYEQIVNNLNILADKEIPISLRINAHSGAEMDEALMDLEERKVKDIKGLFIYDGQVSDSFYDHNIQGIECPGHLENEEQLKMIYDIRTVIKNRGWHRKYQYFPLFQRNAGICSFTREGNYCIDPLGNLYLCLFQIGNQRYAIGHINEVGQPEYLPIYEEIMARNPFDSDECDTCQYMAQCWGGCYVKSFARKGSVSNSFCGNLKRVFPYILKTTLWDKSYENISL